MKSRSAVIETRNGWQFDNQDLEFVAYLKEQESDDWVFEVLSSTGGYEKTDCTDVANSVTEVVTSIKPRLDAAIAGIQNDLAETMERLTLSEQKNVKLAQDNTQLGEE